MPYVQRDGSGNIIGVFNVPQPGMAEELVSDDDSSLTAYHNALSAPIKTVIYKADIWRRATDAEATTIDAQLNAQSVRLRRMWQDSQTLDTNDEMYNAVLGAFTTAFGVERATQLLAPSA